MTNVIAPTTARAYFLTDGTVRDNYGDTLFHPLSNVNDIEIYVEDGDSDNVMSINYNPAIRKKWATHWFPCFYRGLVEHTLDGESEPRTFAQYRTTMPIIVSSMNQNSETPMGVTSTLRQQAGSNLIGSYATVASLPTSYGDWLDLQDMEENDVVAYVYEAGVNGFYMVEFDGSYAWTLQTSGITNYVTTKQYDTWELTVQGGFGNPAEITELTDQQYILIWQELSQLSAHYTSNYELIQDLIDGTTPAGKAIADQNGNVINTTYQLLSNLVTAFQVTPDDTHYASEKLIYDTIQNILSGTTPFTAMTLYNANGNAVFTIDDEGVLRVAYSGINHEVGENLFVRGDEVGTIVNGDTVMFDGTIGASGKMNLVAITSSNIALLIANPRFFLGVATQDFSGIQNRLNWYGGVSDLDTTSYPSNVTYPAGEGKVVYVDMVNGGLTYIRPDKPLPVIEVGAVVTYHATQGRILIRPTFSVALGDLHDVDLNGGVAAGDIIIRNAGNTKFEAFNLTAALLLKVDKVVGSSLVTDVEIAHLIALDTQAQLDAKFALKEDKANKGIASGYVPLNSSTKIDSTYLPSYVDDVLEVATYADLPATGESGILYVVIADETSGGNTSTYRWASTVYVQITDTLSSAEVKVLYEANSNTNAYIDADKAKLDLITITVAKNLDDIEAGAQVNVIEGIKVNGTLQTILSKIVNLFVPTKTSELTNDGEDTSSAYVTFDDLGSAGFGDMTEGEYATNGEVGVVDEAVLARTAQQTIAISLTKGTLGKFYATVAGFSLILHNQFTLLFPETTTDLTENVSVSLNGVGGTYKDLKYDDTLNNVVVRHISKANTKATVYYDGTELFMKGEPLLDLPFTFDSIINSNYGNGKPINGSPQFDRLYGLSLPQDVVNGNLASGVGSWVSIGAWNILSVTDEILKVELDTGGTRVYYYQNDVFNIPLGTDVLVKLRIRGSETGLMTVGFTNAGGGIDTTGRTGNLSITTDWQEFTEIVTIINNTALGIEISANAGNFDDVGDYVEMDYVMAIPITNTPLASHTASALNSIVPTYIEDYTYIQNFELQAIGLNLFDKTTIERVDGFYNTVATFTANVLYDVYASPVKGGSYYIAQGDIDTTKTFWDSNGNFISGLNSGTVSFLAPTNAVEVQYAIAKANINNDNQIEETTNGGSASDYQAYNSPQDNFKLTADMLSVGSIRDEAYEDNGVWWKDKYVGRDYNDVVQAQTGWSTAGVLTNTKKYYYNFTSVLDYVIPATTSVVSSIYAKVGDLLFTIVADVNSEVDVENLLTINLAGLLLFRVSSTTFPLASDWETYLQANNVEFVYELNDIITTEIEKDGSLIQESNTTLVQVNNFATEYEITFAMNAMKLVEILNDKIITLRNEMESIRWTDLRTPMTHAVQGNTQKPDYDFTNLGLLFPEDDESEIVYATFQMPHSYKEGSDIEPHIHIGQTLDVQAVFKISYVWVNIGEEIGSWTTITLDTYQVEYVSGTLHQILKASTHIDGTGKKISSILKCKLYRATGDGYTGDILVSDFDIHYQEDSNGSRNEYVK